MGPILPPTNLDVLLLMGRVPGSSAVAASRYELILIFLCLRKFDFPFEGRQFVISCPVLEMRVVRRCHRRIQPRRRSAHFGAVVVDCLRRP